ncbi:MAG: azurin [Bacteroidetes bacterium]|nr:azurin [Bacteroidota bacterium]
MRRTLAAFATLALVTGLVGCKKDEPAPAAPAAAEAPAAPATVTSVEITGNDALQFNTTAFTVKAGDSVTVTFKNIGTQPKDVMGHNFVLLASGSDVAAFATSAMSAKDTDYVPAGETAVLAHTKLLGPGETDTITFVAPAAAGDYPFLCSFLGHSGTMKGVMTVVQ